MLTHYNHQQLFRKYTKKFHHHGVFKCTNYFSSFLFQQHTEVLQQNKKEKYSEHIAFMNSYLEKYTKKFYHQGLYKCSNYFSCLLLQHHNEVLHQNRKEKYSEHITIISSYLEKYTKKFHHQGVFKCSNYFSFLLFQQHTEALQQKKNTVNTLYLSSVTQKNIQRKSMIKEYKSIQTTFPFFYFNNALHLGQANRFNAPQT